MSANDPDEPTPPPPSPKLPGSRVLASRRKYRQDAASDILRRGGIHPHPTLSDEEYMREYGEAGPPGLYEQWMVACEGMGSEDEDDGEGEIEDEMVKDEMVEDEMAEEEEIKVEAEDEDEDEAMNVEAETRQLLDLVEYNRTHWIEDDDQENEVDDEVEEEAFDDGGFKVADLLQRHNYESEEEEEEEEAFNYGPAAQQHGRADKRGTGQ